VLGKLFAFFILSSFLGPWGALAVLIALYWALDRSTLRYLPGPWVIARRFMKRRKLEAVLSNNPHDYRSELELGRLLLEAKAFGAARPHLEKAAQAYKEDGSVQAFQAVCWIGCGEVDRGVAEVERVMGANPKLRFGEPWLDAGELLVKSDPKRAGAMLERFLAMQPSNVKGLFLRGKALEKAGDPQAGRISRKKAWSEYATNPAFKRREARVWAYRANPLRPALYAAGVFAALGVIAMLYH
jgi:tetratricopeptide (TPR) repeat protein